MNWILKLMPESKPVLWGSCKTECIPEIDASMPQCVGGTVVDSPCFKPQDSFNAVFSLTVLTRECWVISKVIVPRASLGPRFLVAGVLWFAALLT
jgi:hypothetical protein